MVDGISTKKSAVQKKLLAEKVKEIVRIMMSVAKVLSAAQITASSSMIYSMRRMIAV